MLIMLIMLIDLCAKHGRWKWGGGTGNTCLNSYKIVDKMPLCTLQSCPFVFVREGPLMHVLHLHVLNASIVNSYR